MTRHPGEIPRWIHDRWQGATPIQAALPWLSWPCVDFLRRHVKPGLRVLEWGGGGSTIFFTAAGCEVTTIESNRVWQERILKRLAQAGDAVRRRVTLRFVDCEEGQPGGLDSYVDQVHDGGPWDIVLIDGWAQRIRCMKESASEVKTGGLVILDNAEKDYTRVPAALSSEFKERLKFSGFGPCRIRPTRTDVFVMH